MNELLNELLTLIDQNLIRIQPYTLDDSQRPAIERQIADWTRRARIAIPNCHCVLCELARQGQAIDPQHCYLCDRPKLDCACVVEDFV